MFAAFDDDAKKIIVVGKQKNATCFESELYYYLIGSNEQFKRLGIKES